MVDPAADAAPPRDARPSVGAGRVLVLAYGFFVLAAGARSAVQLSTHLSRAPLAYVLSAVAAAIYLAGAVAVAVVERHPHRRPLAARVVVVELSGVVLVGTASVLWPQAFPDATVWSGYGAGYGYVPLVLPVLAVIWLARQSARRDRAGR